jgi:CRP-like cAMP-binding protein
MTDLSQLKSTDTPPRRRTVEDEEDIVRRLSAEAKLRIYEEVKELLDAKAARDAQRGSPTTHASVAARPPLGAQLDPNLVSGPRKPAASRPKSVEDSSGDLIVFSEGGSYRLGGGNSGTDSSLDSSRTPAAPARRGGERRPKPEAKPAKAAAPPALTGAEDAPSKRFTLLTGLSEAQVKLLRDAGSRQKYEEGETIFSPGDPVQGVPIVLRGRVEIATDLEGREHVSTRRSGEWFGELEPIVASVRRRSRAKALRATSLFEIPGNPLELFRWLTDRKAAMRLLRNSICMMGRHLREMAEESAKLPSRSKAAAADSNPSAGWEAARALLPSGLLERIESCRSFEELRLLDGQHLYREGDGPDGMYFIQAGTLDVFRRSGRRQRKLSTLEGPAVIGDVSFFSHHDRSVSVRAFGPVRLLKFSGERFDRVKQRDPEETLDLLLLCAEFAAALQRVRLGPTARA